MLEKILEDVLGSIDLDPKTEVAVNYKTDSQTDYEIFIRKGFKIYSFRPYGREEEIFFERWSSNNKGKLFTLEGLKKELVILLRSF